MRVCVWVCVWGCVCCFAYVHVFVPRLQRALMCTKGAADLRGAAPRSSDREPSTHTHTHTLAHEEGKRARTRANGPRDCVVVGRQSAGSKPIIGSGVYCGVPVRRVRSVHTDTHTH